MGTVLPDAVQALKTAMEARKLSVPQLAKRSGVAFPSIYDIFNGHANPKLDTLEKLSSALQLRVCIAKLKAHTKVTRPSP